MLRMCTHRLRARVPRFPSQLLGNLWLVSSRDESRSSPPGFCPAQTPCSVPQGMDTCQDWRCSLGHTLLLSGVTVSHPGPSGPGLPGGLPGCPLRLLPPSGLSPGRVAFQNLDFLCLCFCLSLHLYPTVLLCLKLGKLADVCYATPRFIGLVGGGLRSQRPCGGSWPSLPLKRSCLHSLLVCCGSRPHVPTSSSTSSCLQVLAGAGPLVSHPRVADPGAR